MEKHYIIIRDGLIRSIIADTYFFILFIGTFAINHFLFNDSNFGAVTMGIVAFMTLLAKTGSRVKKFQSDEEAIKWIKENK